MTRVEARALLGETRADAKGEVWRCLTVYMRTTVVIEAGSADGTVEEISIQTIDHGGRFATWNLADWRRLPAVECRTIPDPPGEPAWTLSSDRP